MSTLQFNAEATKMIQERTGGRARVEFKDGAIRVRPTDRKAGPHVLADFNAHGRGGTAVKFDDKQLEKLGAGDILGNTSEMYIVKDKYGWFTLVDSAPEGGNADARVSVRPNA